MLEVLEVLLLADVVLLEDVEVPAANLIGGVEGQGLKQANAVFGYTRLMVGAFGLGAGQEAMRRAVRYAKERVQFGDLLIDKEGYAEKLLASHWVALAAGRAYVDEIAGRLDSGEQDLQVEGAIAKLWCTEVGNTAAEAALQALGGYGYTREYMVEKIKRDVRITTIYEGTSEIQQSIIGMYRWKDTVRSKGGFYKEQAEGLEALHADCGDVGADLAAAAARDLNRVILHCHKTRTARRQTVMFRMADMMTAVEIAGAFCRAAAAAIASGDADAQVLAASARINARKALALVARSGLECAGGLVDSADADAAAAFAAFAGELESRESAAAHLGLLTDAECVVAHLKSI